MNAYKLHALKARAAERKRCLAWLDLSLEGWRRGLEDIPGADVAIDTVLAELEILRERIANGEIPKE